MRCCMMDCLSWGLSSLAWVLWTGLQWAFVPTYAFILLPPDQVESRQFDIGLAYKYGYETSVFLNEPQLVPVPSPTDVGFKIELEVEITVLWNDPKHRKEQLLQIKIATPSLSVKARQGPTPEGLQSRPSRADGHSQSSLMVLWSNGEIKKVYGAQDDQLTMLNIKKGIASLLQYKYDVTTSKETDTSGLCDVIYKTIDQSQVVKTKNNCQTRTDLGYNHTNQVLGANIKNEASITYKFSKENKIPTSITSIETHFLRIHARPSTGSEVISRQSLQLKGSTDHSKVLYIDDDVADVIKKLPGHFRAEPLESAPDHKECISCKTLEELILNFKSALSADNLASQSSAIAFIRILQKIRESDYQTIYKILKNKKLAKILPQLLDITAAAQTRASHEAARATINFNDASNIALPERYLLAVSLSSHPPQHIIADLFNLLRKKVKNGKLFETLLLTVASLTHTYIASGGPNQQLIEDITTHLIQELDKCDQEHCQLMYIRSLKNLRAEELVPLLLKFIKGKERKSAVYAMRALHSMPYNFFNKQVKHDLEIILFELDGPHDSTVKSLALNALLNHDPSEELLEGLFSSLYLPGMKEMKTLVLSQIKDTINTNYDTKQKVERILKNPKYKNYHILGQNGLSTSFSRTLARERDCNSTFSNILEINGGLLKRSTVDVYVNSLEASMRLLSFETFAGGLTMFGGDDEAVDDGDEANAGIEITLLNNQLRPYVFFTGQGELMGHVWAGTGSERTTALQGSVLLHDHKQYIPLQNGLTVEMLLTGVVSYDFSGQVQISLWNRNAHSLVEVAAAVVVQGQARVDNSIVQTMIEFNSGAQSQLNFVSDLDFSDDITMCLQMVQPDFEIIENVRKLERIPGTKYTLRKYKRRVTPSPGRTYVMNKKNNELCNKMFN